jgi:glycosyl transferase family 25
MWNFIDKIIYINLDSREDRRNIMQNFFEQAEIPTDKILRFSAIKKIRGALGCLESHTAVLRMAKQNSWKNVLILEDDLEWLDLKEGYSKLEQLTQQPKWDVIMLTGWFWNYDFPRVYNANNAGAYLVNSSYYDTLLQNREIGLRKLTRGLGFDFNNQIYEADNYWKRLQKTDNWYAVYPCMCRQVDGYSDHCRQDIKASLVYGIGSMDVKTQVYG